MAGLFVSEILFDRSLWSHTSPLTIGGASFEGN